MNRALGEGKVVSMVKKYAYIQDDRIGRVYFPLQAANVISNNLIDLRDKFQTDEEVIYTASKQPTATNNCTYVANSVVKRKELLPVAGTITEVCEKFCYVEVKKYGRIFVPFSCRLDMTRPWLGRGAEKGKEVKLKIFRQPDINQCKYVAYGISLDTNEMMRPNRNNEAVDTLFDQAGVIMCLPAVGDGLIYSAHSGLTRLPAALRRPWMRFGRFLKYDAFRQNHEKVHWFVKKCVDLGEFYPVIVEGGKSYLELHAVVNRIVSSPPNRCCWLWNDFIGRIFINSANYVRGLRVMECVKLRCEYTGQYEDVPWMAEDVEIVGADDEIRMANSQLLHTSDDWTVTFLSNSPSFYGFLEHPVRGSGFLAWTDIAEADPPASGTKCRVTFYHQQREKKSQWRAVLITPLNPNGIPTCHHPIYQNTGSFRFPETLEPPVVESAQSSSLSSPAPTMLHHFPPLETSVPPPLPPPIGAPGKNGPGLLKMNGHSTNNHMNGFGEGETLAQHLAALASVPPPDIKDVNVNNLHDPFSSALSINSPRVSSSVSTADNMSDRNGSQTDGFAMFAANGAWPSATNEFNAWQPLDIGSSSRDVGTQTDVFVEQTLLKDILRNGDLLRTILNSFPEHMEKVVSMSSVWKSY